MTILRLIAAVINNPLLLASLMAGVGLLLLRGPRRRAGVCIISVCAVFAYLASTSLVGNALLLPLEHGYPAFDPAQAVGIRDIVVLGSGYEPGENIPVSGMLSADGLARIVEGVRLARLRPGARLLVSGGARAGSAPSALGYARMAAELGIPQSAMVMMDRAVDTKQEAADIAALLGQSPFILVTSAFHMPRAMRLMRGAGANPVPAPTGQLVHIQEGTRGFGVIPGARGLYKTEIAIHEYLGLIAVELGLGSTRR